MSHPDEGTMQMLLDGELDAEERARVESHLRSCAPCATRLAEARGFMEEADRLVEVLAVPEQPASPRRASTRRTLIRTLAWAASIVLAVGVGYWGRGPGPVTPTSVMLQEPDGPLTTNTGPTTVQPAPTPRAAATPATARPPVEAKAVGAVGAVGGARANELAREPPAAPAEKVARTAEEPVSAWRVISMEEGVRMLGGQIRLIDGLSVDRVETGPGTAVPGADPAVAVVRVVYASGTVTLDEQRPATPAAARREAAADAVAGAVTQPGVTAWQERGNVRFVVTGSVTPDSLRALGALVR